MAEIKRTFTAARMNKDLDERLIARGEYRDAMNIQIRTTDGDAAGTVQNIQGNAPTYYAKSPSFDGGHITTSLKNANIKTKCIGSVADERNDKAYFLFASPKIEFDSASDITGTTRFTDYILEQDSEGGFLPVVVDQWGIVETYSEFNGSFDFNTDYSAITSTLGSKYRVGMSVQAYTSDGTPMMEAGTKIVRIVGNVLVLNKFQTANTSTCSYLIFTHPKALGFNYDVLVTGINVIDNFLFYTTNVSEPKKINIQRCKAGTPSNLSHTKLKLNKNVGSDSLISYPGANEENLNNLIPANNGDLLEEHLTVIRKAPLQAPDLIMSSTDREGVNSFSLTGQNFSNIVEGNIILVTTPDGVLFREGDYVNLTCTNDFEDASVSSIRGVIDGANEFPNVIAIQILTISFDITTANTEWLLELEQTDKPLFELKFPRFAYRYKYNDGEYSSFSPWSEIAFLPGDFDYQPRKGYNLGMVNTLRELKITNLLPDDRIKPDDISCIDILYKSTDSPVVYIIKTIEKNIDPEWSTSDTSTISDVHITSDMVHKVVPSDQILRSWDNVPRFAKAQEMVGNRLVYGNYLQGYGDDFTVSIDQKVVSRNINQNLTPEKSIKSLRSYKFGLVYGDKYGRETPVISVGQRVDATEQNTESQTGDNITIPKKQANQVNNFAVKQFWSNGIVTKPVPSWIDYVKYYVKETSTEYYNMVMDRWYNAEDGNVWISFSSADRNKVDEQTYLILKNENGNDTFVEEEARYKIISIANEAPDFIKTFGRIIGGNQIVETESNYNNDNEPSVLMTSLIFDLNNFEVTDIKGKLKVRIKAVGPTQTFYTGYREVTRVENPTEDSSGEIQIDFVFNQEANFPQLFVNTEDNYTISDATNPNTGVVYYLEFRDDTVENKPEFDGRFFVKILRDNTLESKVMNLADLEASSIYTVVDSIDFDYIDTSSSTNPASTGTQANYNFSNIPGTNGQYYDFWTNRSADRANGNVSNIFIDGITHLGLFGSSISSSDFPSDGSERGFAKSGDAGVDSSTFDKIYFSAFQSNFFSSNAPVNNEFKNRMTQVGQLFRFRNDPNNSVYKVVSGGFSGGASIINMPFTNHLNQFTLTPPLLPEFGGENFRSSFFTTFRRLDPETGLVTNGGIDVSEWDPRGDMKHDGTQARQLEIVQKTDIYNGNLKPSPKAAIWETEPKDSVDLDLYYEASNAMPVKLNYNNTPMFAPVGSEVTVLRGDSKLELGATVVVSQCFDKAVKLVIKGTATVFTSVPILVGDTIIFTHADGTKTRTKVTSWLDATLAVQGTIKEIASAFSLQCIPFGPSGSNKLQPINGDSNSINGVAVEMSISGGNLPAGAKIITAGDNQSYFGIGESGGTNLSLSEPAGPTAYTINAGSVSGYFGLDPEVYNYEVQLPWSNCYSFGNGVESDRIRDDFNAPTIDNGVNVSTVLSDYKVEHRQNGLIYSGIYNSNSSVNNLNEFNMSQKITKDLNPTYGSIQALKTRDTDLITFTEDKVLRILANKDALFNADGNTNLTSSDRVLGQAVPYVGDYGISKNPESIAKDQYRIYFTDKQRGAVLRLSRDGLTPISDVGMRTWFRDNLHKSNQLIGSFDTVSGEYNISIKYIDAYSSSEYTNTTVSFNESGKGWVSFKSFVADSGVSVSGNYFTCNINKIYRHHVDTNTQGNTVIRNNFYGDSSKHSTITAIFNEQPGVVKNFKTLNYEGSEGKKITINQMPVTSPSGVSAGNLSNDSYSALLDTASTLFTTSGWSFSSVITDLQSGKAEYVKQKEGKWFSNVNGEFSATDISSIDESEFNVQGLGTASTAPIYSSGSQLLYTITVDGNG